MIKYILFTAFFFFYINSFAKNYYLSNNGNDGNIGTSPNKSWKSINRLNKQKLNAGDSILFKSGDKFVGTIVVNQSGTEKNRIVFSQFGKGEKPLLSGAIEVKNWLLNNGKIYETNSKDSIYGVFVNNVLQTNARFPNTGFLKMDGGFNNKVAFFDNQLTQKAGYWVGTNIRFRTWDWEFRQSLVTQYENHKVTIRDSSTNTLSKGWGYFFDNKFSELDTLKEWYYNAKENKLFLIPEYSNLNNQTVEALIYSNAFELMDGAECITIENLQIEKYHKNGITAGTNVKNVSIIGNSFNNINLVAINFDLNAQNCFVKNNNIKNTNGRGVSALEPKKMVIDGNKISKIGDHAGYGISGVNGMIGIVIENIEVPKQANSNIAKFNTISNNRLDSIGYVGIRMDGAESLMEKNVISNSLYQLSDGAAIYCWAKDGDYYTYNNKIKNNVVFNIKGNNNATPSEENPIANGIYIDNNCYNILVAGNTVFNSSGSGIHINSGAYNNNITQNTVFNCKTGISIAEWLNPNSTFGNVIDSNVVVSIEKSQKIIELTNWLLPSTHRFAFFKANNYVNLHESLVFQETYLTADKGSKVTQQYNLLKWRNTFGYDKASLLLGPELKNVEIYTPTIFYNDSNKLKTNVLKSGSFCYLDGKSVTRLKISPFSSIILLKK